MWLTGRLKPSVKTIANFHKENGLAIRSVCRRFVVPCQRLDLFKQAIDGKERTDSAKACHRAAPWHRRGQRKHAMTLAPDLTIPQSLLLRADEVIQ